MLAVLLIVSCRTTSDSSLDDSGSCPVSPSGTSCHYYECLEQEYKCGTAGYPHSYGEKYCKKFQAACDGKLSTSEAQQWIRGTTKCLQRNLEDSKAVLSGCQAVSDHAFKSHSYCYTKGSAANGGRNFCSLGPITWSTVLGCVDRNDRYSADILRQIRNTASSCIGFFGAAFFLGETADQVLDEVVKDVVRDLSNEERRQWALALSELIKDIDELLE